MHASVFFSFRLFPHLYYYTYCTLIQLIFQYIRRYTYLELIQKGGDGMHIEIDLERLLKEKHKSKNFVCEECGLQRTQFNNYCKNKVSRVDLTILAKICDCLDCTPNDILKIVKETAKDE